MRDNAMTLELDARQRAMLQEMHVPVWWPVAAALQGKAPEVPDAEPQTSHRAAPIAAAPIAAARETPAAQVRRESMHVPVEPLATLEASAALPALAPSASVGGTSPPAAQRTERTERTVGIETMGWPALQQAVVECTACTLCSTRKNTVFGVGPASPLPDSAPRADWMIVGEAPGENEDIQGEPFVGQAGKLLDNMLRTIGVSRREPGGAPARSAFITNVLKCRPPANRNPEPDEVAQCEPFLRRQIELLQPKIILAMGRFSVQSLLRESVPDVQTTPIGRLRGKAYRYHGVPVVVSYHPAYLLRSLPEKAKAWADLCLAMSVKKDVDAV